MSRLFRVLLLALAICLLAVIIGTPGLATDSQSGVETEWNGLLASGAGDSTIGSESGEFSTIGSGTGEFSTIGSGTGEFSTIGSGTGELDSEVTSPPLVSAGSTSSARLAPLQVVPTKTVSTAIGDTGGPNRTVFSVDLTTEGNAHWNVRTEFDLTNESQVQAFQELGDDFETGDGPQLGLSAFLTAVELVDAETDRSMELRNENREWSIAGDEGNQTGTLSLQFTWENFAVVRGDRIEIDEGVLTANEDTWFDGLSADQELVIRPPPGYGVDDARVAPQDGELRWVGPEDFSVRSLQSTFIGERGGVGDDGDTDTGVTTDRQSFLPVMFVFAIVLIALVVGLSIQRDAVFERVGISRPGEEDGESGAQTADTGREDPSGAPAGEDGESGAAEASDAEDEVEDDDIDYELLSDEERIEHLLDQNGGRMKQATIVKETDWSNAKVSQLLSSMEEDGRVDKLRIGRENLISFPEEDITDIGNE